MAHVLQRTRRSAADALSCHPCDTDGCQQCEKREDQEAKSRQPDVKCATVYLEQALSSNGLAAVAEWELKQEEDVDIRPVVT